MSIKQLVKPGVIASFASVAVMVVAILSAASQMPAEASFAVHWGLDGRPDRFEEKGEVIFGLFLLPIITALVSLLLASIPLLEKNRESLLASAKTYHAAWGGFLFLMVVLTLGLSWQVTQPPIVQYSADNFVRLIVIANAIMLVVVGNYLPKTQPNGTVGVRTVWALSSEVVWAKTHRMAGLLFVIAGIIGLVGALLFTNFLGLLGLLIVPVLVACLASMVFSWWAWRQQAH